MLDLKTGGTVLTGLLSDAEHYVAISDGRVEGNRLSWSAKLTKPMRMSQIHRHHRGGPYQRLGQHLLGNVTFTGKRA